MHVLPKDMPDAARAYVASMPQGRVELFSLSSLDHTGVACWNAIFLNQDGTRWHGVVPHGVGYGVDDDGAIIGTTGELAEAVHSATQIHRVERRTGSYASLSAQLGARAVQDPLTLCVPAGSLVDADTTLEWVPARRWPSGETVWLPIDIAACSVGDLSPGYQPFTTPITNGLGAGPTLDFAIGHGVCELLQRDGNGTGFRAMDRGIALDLGAGPTDPRTAGLLARLDALGINVLPKFATDEFGTANVYCVGAERDGVAAPFPIMVTAAGEAASLDRETVELLERASRVSRVPLVRADATRGAGAWLGAFDAALCASGTASLEAALAGAPPVVSYRVGWLTEAIVRPFLQTDLFALPNVLLKRRAFPELMQRDATVSNMALALERVLGLDRREMQAACDELRPIFGARREPSREVADMITSWL